MSSLNDSMEDFLTEIEKYSKRREEEKKNTLSEVTNYDEEFEEVSDNLIDNLHDTQRRSGNRKEES